MDNPTGKQASKPQIGVRPPSGSSRPMSGIKRETRPSHYQGGLASNKYFEGPNDFNKIAPKNIPGQSASQRPEDLFNQSSSSFHSMKPVDTEQQKKLQKQVARPFSLRGAGSAKGQRQRQDPRDDLEADESIDDSSKSDILKMLDRREKDKEEYELESCYSELKAKALEGGAANEEQLEALANQSLTDLREMQEIQGLNPQQQALAAKKLQNASGSSFYKPQMGGARPGSQLSTPNMKTRLGQGGSGSARKVTAPDWKTQKQSQKQGALSKPNFKQNDSGPAVGSSRLDAIYAQLKDLQSFKDEIMGELEEFMDDVEHNSDVIMPEQFEEVVDIVVNDSRARAQEHVSREEAAAARSTAEENGWEQPTPSYGQVVEKLGLEETEEKPFWTKFLRTDYLDEADPAPLLPGVLDVLDGNKGVDEMIMEAQGSNSQALALYRGDGEPSPRTPGRGEPQTAEEAEEQVDAEAKAAKEAGLQREWAKIRKLEGKLGAASKAQQEMSSKMYEHKVKMEGALGKARAMEEEKQQVTQQYDVKNKRGLTSQASNTAQKGRPPVQSGKAIFKSKAQMAAEAEAKLFGGASQASGGHNDAGGDTFLTDLMQGKKQASEGRRASARSAMKPGGTREGRADAYSEMDIDDIEDELRDVVFDYENSQALVAMADNFLHEGNSLDNGDSQSQGGRSTTSNVSSASRIKQNKIDAAKYDPTKIKLLQDRLSDKSKARLAILLTDIDENMDELMKEKADYAKWGMKSNQGGSQLDTRSQISRQTGASRMSNASNAYSYAGTEQSKMQELNEALEKYNPALLGSRITGDNFDTEASVISSGKKGMKLTRDRLNEFQGLNDDTRSMISMQSNLTGFSRKSAVSMLNIDAIVGLDSKKGSYGLPGTSGDKGLKAAAQRRTEKAQMATIEANLKRLQNSEDLSYAAGTENQEEGESSQIDGVTLARLIDECRDEQEQRSMMELADDQSQHSGLTSVVNPFQQSELSMRQLARVERSSKNIMEAQRMLTDVAESQRAFAAVSRDFASMYTNSSGQMSEVKAFYAQELRDSEQMLKDNDSSMIKQKVHQCEEDLIDLELRIEVNERRLQMLAEEAAGQPELGLDVDIPPTAEVTQQLADLQSQAAEVNPVLKQVEEDFAEFNRLQDEVECSTTEDRRRLLEDIELRALERNQEQAEEIANIKSYTADHENPQVEQPIDPEQQALHEKFFNEVESIGQEQIKQLEDRQRAYDDIQAKLAELTSSLQPETAEPEEVEKKEEEAD